MDGNETIAEPLRGPFGLSVRGAAFLGFAIPIIVGVLVLLGAFR